ncbi:hypothetical protein [Nevskia sp.]|uniref:hypothetical protein n=1 Tax=Nevskia sp. TaxID=1929292 RepID=UPI0025DF2D87|nr:hypothetical protein [Nevskia sp.]
MSKSSIGGSCAAIPSGLIWLSSLTAGLAHAAPGDRIGEPILAVANDSAGFGTFPAIARNADGRFAVVWYNQTRSVDGSDPVISLMARYYSTQGQPLGSPFRVDEESRLSLLPTDPNSVSAGMDDAGNLVVLWQEFGATILTPGVIRGRQFNADGSPRGREFVMPFSTSGNQLAPDVAVAANGDFVAVWAESNLALLPAGQFTVPVADASRIRSQRFGADGARRGLPTLVDSGFLLANGNSNQGGNSSVGFPAIAIGRDGQFAITWTRCVQSDRRIMAARYAANGQAQGARFLVSPAGDYPDIGIDASGRLLIASDRAFRRYQADGQAAGAEVPRPSFLPKLGVTPLGAFVLASVGRDPAATVPFAPPVELVQFFDADAQALTVQKSAAPSVAAFGNSTFHGVGVDAAGNYAVVLEGQAGTPASPGQGGIYVQLFSGQ